MKRIIACLIFSYLWLFSCDQKQEKKQIEKEELSALRDSADSIATKAQILLMKNVSNAISKGGTEYAVEFCNTNAAFLTDSLADKYHITLKRITNKPRNPDNGLQTTTDKKVFENFSINKDLQDSLLQQEQGYVYYKRINLAMPTCIKCHGNVGEDIDNNTYQKIKSHYPSDQAIGYRLNDYRALWKIEYNKKTFTRLE